MELVENKMKQTELGWIPEDWEVSNLEQIGDVITGLTYNPSNVKSYGTLVLRSSNIKNNRLAFDDNVFVDMNLPERVIVLNNDILICVRNGSRNLIGKCALIDEKTQGQAFGAFMSIFRSKFNSYIFYSFQSNVIQRQIENNLGATINQITNKDIKRFTIPLPPLPEQKAISAALSDTDAWIESLEKLVAKKRLIKQGAMQELLTPKEGWEVKRLGEIISSAQLGGNYQNTETQTSNPLVKMGNILRGSISLKKIEYISNDITPSEKDLLKINDLLFNTRNTLDLVGKVCVWRNELNKAYFNSNIMRITFDPKYIVSNTLMNAIFNSRKTVQSLRNIATGTTSVAAIYTRDLHALEIIYPRSKDEQTRIATILSDMDSELEALENKLVKAKAIKQGMMQVLLTGKVRLV